ncbi:MAG TPA: hypothetical protein VEL74_02305 [Thermoanaerobaculia bacterium]|nr:hypothetical protein [Thermoanaerobaculia bacterium]
MSFGEQFLVHPDLFPARRSGETWGERELVIDLPGGPYLFTGLNAGQEAHVRRRFGSFCGLGAGSPPAVETRFFRAAEADFREIDTRGWEYGLDLDFGLAAVRVAGLRLMARLDWRPGLAAAVWTPDAGGEAFAGIFENAFRALVSYRLLESGGVVLHGAALARRQEGGGAFLFLGRSGAGKSTVSRLGMERGLTVLSDDLNALLPGELPGAAVATVAAATAVVKLPFTGDVGEPGAPSPPHPLRALFRLEKSAEEAVSPLSRAEVVGCLLACSPFLNTDPYRRETLVSILSALVPRSLPAYALRFSLTGRFWELPELA